MAGFVSGFQIDAVNIIRSLGLQRFGFTGHWRRGRIFYVENGVKKIGSVCVEKVNAMLLQGFDLVDVMIEQDLFEYRFG